MDTVTEPPGRGTRVRRGPPALAQLVPLSHSPEPSYTGTDSGKSPTDLIRSHQKALLKSKGEQCSNLGRFFLLFLNEVILRF